MSITFNAQLIKNTTTQIYWQQNPIECEIKEKKNMDFNCFNLLDVEFVISREETNQ